MKKTISFILIITLCTATCFAAQASPEISAPCGILMERDTGKILFEKDSHKKLPPASVTKIMTLLIVFENIDSGNISLEDEVTVSEHAASMGGSQVFLSPGEKMSVDDMLKATFISSGNDSAVALAEHISGSEEVFVGLMNKRAKELNMNDSTFKNCTGLDEDGHITSAHDIAIMSKELIKHKKIRDYTTTWIDSLRGGTFQLANTNKLVRSYRGITGLKTGSTSISKFCLSATAERDGMELIAVILAAPSSKERFADASRLLDFGFANYAIFDASEKALPDIPVILGNKEMLSLEFADTPSIVTEKSKLSSIEIEYSLPEEIKAPVAEGQKIGVATLISEGNKLAEMPIIASEATEKLSVFQILIKMISSLLIR